MQKEFFTTMKRKSHRERFYSSMNYDQFCDVYGPPTPFVRPQEDPVDDMPPLDLEEPDLSPAPILDPEAAPLPELKMGTILEIEGSENFTQNVRGSPRDEFLFSSKKSRDSFRGEDRGESPRRVRLRMRSQSDNSQYLIFNFLERVSEKGRKRIKLDSTTS